MALNLDPLKRNGQSKPSLQSVLNTAPLQTKKPFAATNLGIAVNTVLGLPKAGLQVGKEIGQGIARNIGSAGVTVAKKAGGSDNVNIPQSLQWLFSDAPIDSVEKRIVELEPKLKEWGQLQQKKTTGEKKFGQFVANNPTSIAFVGVMGAVGLDLTPFGGGDDALKALKNAATEADALKVLNTMKVEEDVARQIAGEVVNIKTTDEAKAFLIKLAEAKKGGVDTSMLKASPSQSKTAKTSLVDTNEVSRALPSTVRQTDESVKPLVVEAKKYKSADEFVKGQPAIYHGTPNKFKQFDAERTPGGSAWFSDNLEAVQGNKVEGSRASGQEWNVMERYIKPEIKLVDRTTEEGKRMANNLYPEQMESQGFRGIKHEPDPERGSYVELFYPNEDTLTRTQLEDIWKQANSRVDEVGEMLTKQFIEEKKPKVRQMKKSQEVPSLLRLAEQEGQFPTQQRGITLEKIEKKRIELSLLEENVLANPARQLAKYANKNGELPEVLGKGKGIFARSGDDIVRNLGFEDSEQAREAYQAYTKRREAIVEAQETLKDEVRVFTKQQRDLPKEFRTLTEKQVDEAIEKFQEQGIGGDTTRIIRSLEKKGLTKAQIDNIVLENGEKLVETVRVKKETNGVMSAVITKRDLDELEKGFAGRKVEDRWVKRNSPRQIARGIKTTALDYYEVPQIFFARNGIKTQVYDPVRDAERNAQKMKTSIFKKFEDAGLMKQGGWFTADRFKLSKKESENIARYFLERQGKGGGKKLEDLSETEAKFVEVFDSVIKETEQRFFDVAKLNGKEPRKVDNYAPIMTDEDLMLATEMGDADFIFRKHPAFFSLKEREENVPFEVYELDYRRVAARWIDQMANFNHLGEVTPQVKYLVNSEEFKGIVGDNVAATSSKWLRDALNPQVLSPAERGGKFMRKAAAISSLGLNLSSVIKQALSQIPVTIIEGAPPKFRSQFAKDFGINVKELPSIKERKGNIAIQDMQEGFARAFLGPLSEFDKNNAQLTLNSLLDKNYKRVLKENNYKELTPDQQAQVLKVAQDKLDLWYGGMTKVQLPRAFRTELGKLINMFIGPLTSQLNGFIYAVAKEKGVKRAEKTAAVVSSALAIAYMEQVITNLSPTWSDEKTMTEDVLSSLAGNIPLVSQAVFAYKNDAPLGVSPIISSVTRTISQFSKYSDDTADAVDVGFAMAEMFGLPKQVRRTTEGVEMIIDGGVRDKNGKLDAPVKGDAEYLRALIRGKYGTAASRDWVRNIGVKSENQRWHVPEVEFLQVGDYDRKAELYQSFNQATQDFLYNELSEGQQKKLDNALLDADELIPTNPDFVPTGGRPSLDSILESDGGRPSLESILE